MLGFALLLNPVQRYAFFPIYANNYVKKCKKNAFFCNIAHPLGGSLRDTPLAKKPAGA